MGTKEVRQLIQSATQLHSAGKLDQADRIYQQVLSIRPGYPDAVHLLGVIACQRGLFDHGIELVSQAVSLSPKTAAYHNSLGNALRGKGQLNDAIAAYRTACQLNPKDLQTQANLAAALADSDRPGDAIELFNRLIETRGDIPEWHVNRATAQLNTGQTTAAIASLKCAIALRPDLAGAHAKLSTALLRIGDFQTGWSEAEWRFSSGVVADPAHGNTTPRWDGSPLAGRTLLIYCEQGFGDNIQFIRYARLIDKQDGRLILQCRPQLASLLRQIKEIDQLVLNDQPLPLHDVHIPVMSLPMVFKTTLVTIPNQVPYLTVDPDAAAVWSARLIASPMRIGLVWAGNPNHTNDARRSCPAEAFNTLMDLKEIDFYRLQLPRELPPPSGLPLIDQTALLNDFTDTAALIANLDLVISVDTAIAHLAGAIGKPVWLLLPFAAEWRWLEQRDDSPWYPTARLIRQATPGDWVGVLKKVREMLLKTKTATNGANKHE